MDIGFFQCILTWKDLHMQCTTMASIKHAQAWQYITTIPRNLAAFPVMPSFSYTQNALHSVLIPLILLAGYRCLATSEQCHLQLYTCRSVHLHYIQLIWKANPKTTVWYLGNG